MELGNNFEPENSDSFICPDITTEWELGKHNNSGVIVLKSKQDKRQLLFSEEEGYALAHFSGHFTVKQVQTNCEHKFTENIAIDFVCKLIEKLIAQSVILSNPKPTAKFKQAVQWIEHPEGYWILRNTEDVTFMQVSNDDKLLIEQFENLPLKAISQEFCVSSEYLKNLLRLLAATGMLEGTKPPKPPKRKFTPLQLLFFKIPLFNPDAWLTKHISSIRWIWTLPFFLFLLGFLSFSGAVALNQRQEILSTIGEMVTKNGASLLIPFVLVTTLVVTLHELAHAFTLKHYGGIVPEVGLFFMLLMPSAYTNTSDSYCLVKRRQRVLVVAAGVLCQITIAAIALWMWHLSAPGSWLYFSSFLIMAAATFTVALNLNPLSKFDGYYLTVALTGINNLRSRSFKFYANLITFKPIQEYFQDIWILAAYAPFSLAYTFFVFGFLLLNITDWTLTNIPTTAFILLIIWAIYYFSPTSNNQKSRTTMTASNPDSPKQSQLQSNLSDTKQKAINFPIKRLLATSSIIAGLFAISQIPAPSEVWGDAVVESTPKARQQVSMKISGTVEKVLVEANTKVKAGAVLLKLKSEEIEKEISNAEVELKKARTELESSQRMESLQARVREAEYNELAVRQKTAQVRLKLQRLNTGAKPPEILQLESEIMKYQTEQAGLKSDLLMLEQRHSRYKDAIAANAISKDTVMNLQQQQQGLKTQISAKNTQIEQIKARIAAVTQQWQDELTQVETEANRMQAAKQSVLKDVEAVNSRIEQQINYIKSLEIELERQRGRQKDLVLTASVDGTVLASDLDKLVDRKLQAGDKILEIANLNKLTAKVQIRQEDYDLIKPNAVVKFRPRRANMHEYTAIIQAQNIDSQMQGDTTHPQKTFTVSILINNDDNQLRPGEAGYAHIETEQINLAQKIQREFLKLVPLEKFV